MFIQGKHPALIVTPAQYIRVAECLHAAGFKRHRGPRWTRPGEEDTFRVKIGEMQNHVQTVLEPSGLLAIYAHIEPYGVSLKHIISAVMDKADFPAGEKHLKEVLERHGYR